MFVQRPIDGFTLAMNHLTIKDEKRLGNSNTRVPKINYLTAFAHVEKNAVRVSGVFQSLCIGSAAHEASGTVGKTL